MRMQQLREILTHLADDHLAMKRLYKRLHHHADSTRTQLVLAYLQQHQQHAADAIYHYLDDAPERVLDTWYENIAEDSFPAHCEQIIASADLDMDQLMALHLALDNQLLAYLDSAVCAAPTDNIRQALAGLLQSGKNQQQRLVHSTLRMSDI